MANIKPAIHPGTETLNAKVKEIVEAQQKTIAFETKVLNTKAVIARIIDEFTALHNPELDADSGSLTIIEREADKFNSVSLYRKAKAIAEQIEPMCHVRAISIRSYHNKGEGFEVGFSFYDRPKAYKYRHLEF